MHQIQEVIIIPRIPQQCALFQVHRGAEMKSPTMGSIIHQTIWAGPQHLPSMRGSKCRHFQNRKGRMSQVLKRTRRKFMAQRVCCTIRHQDRRWQIHSLRGLRWQHFPKMPCETGSYHTRRSEGRRKSFYSLHQAFRQTLTSTAFRWIPPCTSWICTGTANIYLIYSPIALPLWTVSSETGRM